MDTGGNMRSPARTAELAAAQAFTSEELEAAQPYPMIEISEEMLREYRRRMENRPQAEPDAGLESGGRPRGAST
jgi:hypothetical protein